MYCGHCGRALKDGDSFCGHCGTKTPQIEKIVYVEEKPVQPILGNYAVVALTVMFFLLSLITIIFASVITEGIPDMDHLNGVKKNITIK